MAELRRIRIYPVKALDPVEGERTRIATHGVLEGDREYAIVDNPATEPHDPNKASVSGDGDYMNGKRTAAVHRLRSSVDSEEQTLTLRVNGDSDVHRFDLDNRAELNQWLSEYFDRPVSMRREPTGGYADRRTSSPGPTVISTATLQEIASWFSGIDVEDARRRFRANLEIGGVPAFWEDHLYADHGEAVAFTIGNVQFEGTAPCQRCVVPTRDPDTGEEYNGFRAKFLQKREETCPEWLDSNQFDHYYYLMATTSIPETEWRKALHTGDTVEISETYPRTE